MEDQKMSSFTIAKVDYIKAAGLIAGIAKATTDGWRKFWVYDYREGKNSDTETYYKRFSQCYEMNAASVKEQYHGDEVGALSGDKNSYKKEFDEFFKIGSGIKCYSPEKQRQIIKDIIFFLSSSLYQTENEKYHFMMQHWYNTIIEQLVERVLLSGYESECWGSFKLTDKTA
jgi:hypothetical protein